MKKCIIRNSIPVLVVFFIFLAGCQLDSGKPELSGISADKKEAWVGFEITAAAVYSDPAIPGDVRWKWAVDGITVSRTDSYTPTGADAGKKLTVTAVPAGGTEGYSKTSVFDKIKIASDSPPVDAPLFAGDAGKDGDTFFLAEKGLSNYYQISEKAYNKIAPLAQANKKNKAIGLFSLQFDAAAEDIERIELGVKSGNDYSGESGDHYTITVPGSIGTSANSDYLHRTPVFLTDSESDAFTDIIIEAGGLLFIEYTADPDSPPDPVRQNFSGLIRVKAGGMLLDDGSGFGGYTAGLDSHYWFDYNSIIYLIDPVSNRDEPFIAPQGFPAEWNYITWLPNDWGRNSFIWAVNNTFLLHGRVSQVNDFTLSTHLKLAPGAEFEISAGTLDVEDKNIAPWLPDESTATPEDYLDELLSGNGSGLIAPGQYAKAKIILSAGASITATGSPIFGSTTISASKIWDDSAGTTFPMDYDVPPSESLPGDWINL
jgi:hypothetical protein